MVTTTIVFIASFVGLLGMIVSKWFVIRFKVQSHQSFLSRFDRPLGRFLIGASLLIEKSITTLKFRFVDLLKSIGSSLTIYLHKLIEVAERRTRLWREFARERKIERKSASVFITDVTAYKKELKENGLGQHGQS